MDELSRGGAQGPSPGSVQTSERELISQTRRGTAFKLIVETCQSDSTHAGDGVPEHRLSQAAWDRVVPPLPLGWGLSSSQIWRCVLAWLVAEVEGLLEGVVFPEPFVSRSHRARQVPAASLRVSYCRCGRSSPHLTGPAALGLLDRYTLLSGLALRSPEDCNCSQDNLLGSVEIPVGPRGTVLSWEAFLLLSTRLPTGSLPQRSLRIKALSCQISECPSHCIQPTHSFYEAIGRTLNTRGVKYKVTQAPSRRPPPLGGELIA